jgi:hypothetical protein
VGHAGADHRGEGKPVRRRDRAFERVVGINPVAPPLADGEGVGGAEGQRAFAEHRRAGREGLVEASAEGQGHQVEADFREALLHGVEGIRLEPGERGDEIVRAAVNRLHGRVGLLHREEGAGSEIAEHFGVFPPVGLRGDGKIFAELLVVLPFDVAAVLGDGPAEDVELLVAVVVDETGPEKSSQAIVGRVIPEGPTSSPRLE